MDILVAVVVALLVIAAASTLGARLGIAAPLVLVVVGLGASLLPFVPNVEIAPEWILTGILPPLLYSEAASMPTMNFRREFTTIGGLAIALVVLSAVLLGLFFAWAIPGLGLGWGIALGAIVSPTDAVATSIVKRIGASSRVAAMLEGEGLFNDATSLVLLRAAIAGVAASVTFWNVLGSFLYAIVVALVIGYAIGELNLFVRARVRDAAVNTVISFTVPFLAALPAEALGSSGLVAAAVAGLVTGHGAARVLSPQHRLSDAQNWRTVELILEGAIFLLMGLQLSTIIGNVQADHAGIGVAIGIAAAALVLTIVVRALYVAPLLSSIARRTTRSAAMKPRVEAFQARLDHPDDFNAANAEARRAMAERAERLGIPIPTTGPTRSPIPARPTRQWRLPSARQLEQFRTRLRRTLADINYFLAEPLGWREGAIIVWAGMRGVVTLAAAQTLPESAPYRSLLIFVAFLVATGSLLLQGLTLPRLGSLLKVSAGNVSESDDERARLMTLLDETAATVTGQYAATSAPALDGRQADEQAKRVRLAVLNAQRQVLLDARDDGTFSAAMLDAVMDIVDADQISLEMKGAPVEN